MAADAAAVPQQSFTWVHCAGCGKGLWRRYADHLEMRVSPRGGQVRTIRVLAETLGVLGFSVTCEKCGQVWEATTDLPLAIEGAG